MTHNHQRGSLALAGCLFGILSGAQLNFEHLLHIIICENFPRVKGVPGSAAKGGSNNHEIQAPFCSFRAPNRLRRQINARIPLDYSPQTRKEKGNYLYRFTARINNQAIHFLRCETPNAILASRKEMMQNTRLCRRRGVKRSRNRWSTAS